MMMWRVVRRAGLVCLILVLSLAFASSNSSVSVTNASGRLVVNSDETWLGSRVIAAEQDVLVTNCTLTIVDGNVTVHGNLTFANAQVVAQTKSLNCYFRVAEHGNLTLYSTAFSVRYRCVTVNQAKMEAYDSSVGDVESRNTSRVRMVRCSINSTYAFDDSIQDHSVGWWAGRTYIWGNYWCPRLSLYNCTVPEIEATNATLEIAHTRIGKIETNGHIDLKFDNMTITVDWTHNGQLRWFSGRTCGWGNYWSILWGDTIASGILTDCFPCRWRFPGIDTEPPAPIPQTLKAIGIYLNFTAQGNFSAHIRIHYTSEHAKEIKASTLKLYSLSPGQEEWQPIEVTGVNKTGKYVWGNATVSNPSLTETYYAAFGFMLGDVNRDGKVNILDIVTIAVAYQTSVGNPRYNPAADMNEDGLIDIYDLAMAARNFGKTTWP